MAKLKIAKDLFDLLYPVGTYYETSNANWTPSSAGWYGTWVEDTPGRSTLAQGTPQQNNNTNHGTIQTGELGWNFALGGTLGQYNIRHLSPLTWIQKSGQYYVGVTNTYQNVNVTGNRDFYGSVTNEKGGSAYALANDGWNVLGYYTDWQPSIHPVIVVRRWHRTS